MISRLTVFHNGKELEWYHPLESSASEMQSRCQTLSHCNCNRDTFPSHLLDAAHLVDRFQFFHTPATLEHTFFTNKNSSFIFHFKHRNFDVLRPFSREWFHEHMSRVTILSSSQKIQCMNLYSNRIFIEVNQFWKQKIECGFVKLDLWNRSHSTVLSFVRFVTSYRPTK